MRQRLVRINSLDGIEQPGMLSLPNEDVEKIVIHVHGLYGNFYENRFLDSLAESYTEKGYAFLSFNNRGRDTVSELLKDDESVVIGACFDNFKDCVLDISGVVDWAKKNGYNEIVLEGHSYGCNKVLYYYDKTNDPFIKKIVLLGPCDIPSECVKFLDKEEYEKIKYESATLVDEGRDKALVDFSVMPNGKISAGTYFYDFFPGGNADFLRYVDGVDGKSDILRRINIPVLVVFGDNDECVLTESIDVVKKYLTNNIKDCNIHIIDGANHSFTNKENELGILIKNNI